MIRLGRQPFSWIRHRRSGLLALASLLLLAYSALLWHQTTHDPTADEAQCLLCLAGDRLAGTPPSEYSAPETPPGRDARPAAPTLSSTGIAPRTRWARGPPPFTLA